MKCRKTAGLVLAAVCLLGTGCAKNVDLTIEDMGANRHFQAKTGMTVEEAMDQANFALEKKDETTPARDTKITEQTKTVKIERYAKVTVIDQTGKAQAVAMAGGTVRDALKQADIALGKREYVEPEKAAYLQDGMEIRVHKKHRVTVVADGKQKTVWTEAQTVRDLLDKQKIKVKKNDEVSPRRSKKITDKVTKVVVERIRYKKVKQTESIPYETKIKYSDTMKQGTSRVSVPGVKGKKKVTYRVKYVEGKKKSRKIIKETVIRNPVKEVILYGTATS